MGHMGMIMDEKLINVYDEEVISCKCNCSIVVRMVKGAK
jgi:hypothetical protein